MKTYRPKGRLSKALKWVQRACLVIGASGLAWCLFVYADSAIFQANEAQQFDALRQAGTSIPGAVSPGSLMARIRIPSIGLSAVVVNGDDDKSLRYAVGHIPGTAVPSGDGTVGLAGHRDTFFRGLDRIRKEDDIFLETANAVYRYRVSSMAVVGPDDVEVLRPAKNPSLVLVTCYPFGFIGHAPDRYIVTARRTGIE